MIAAGIKLEARYRVVLVGCGAAKCGERARARDLYTSNLFRLSAAWAEAHAYAPGMWGVLSAEHGFVAADAWIDPYETQLAKDRATRDRWARSAVEMFEGWALGCGAAALQRGERGERVIVPLATVTILAGATYAAPVADALQRRGWMTEQPLRGLGIGHRLAWLSRELRGRGVS